MERIDIFLSGNRMKSLDSSGFPNAGLRGNRYQPTISKLLHILAENRRHPERILSEPALRIRIIAVITSIGPGPGHIHGNYSRLLRKTEPRSAELRNLELVLKRQKFLAHRKAMTVLPLFVMMDSILHHRSRSIHAAQDKIGRKRLQRTLLRLHRHTSHRRQIRIPRTVDENLRRKCFRTIFIVNDYVRNLVPVFYTSRQIRMHVNIHSSFEYHPLCHELIMLRLESDIG